MTRDNISMHRVLLIAIFSFACVISFLFPRNIHAANYDASINYLMAYGSFDATHPILLIARLEIDQSAVFSFDVTFHICDFIVNEANPLLTKQQCIDTGEVLGPENVTNTMPTTRDYIFPPGSGQPGKKAFSVFAPIWYPTPGDHSIVVCANTNPSDDVNQSNNCWLDFYYVSSQLSIATEPPSVLTSNSATVDFSVHGDQVDTAANFFYAPSIFFPATCQGLIAQANTIKLPLEYQVYGQIFDYYSINNPLAIYPNPPSVDTTVNLTNLSPNTTYYYCARVTDTILYYLEEFVISPGAEGGSFFVTDHREDHMYSPVLSFTTPATAPSIDASVVSVTSNTADISGTVVSDGGLAISDLGTCWSTIPSYSWSNCISAGGTSSGTFSQTLTNLPANTLVYFRVYATNPIGIGYSPPASLPESSFTTLPMPGSANISASDTSIDGGIAVDLTWSGSNLNACDVYSVDPQNNDTWSMSTPQEVTAGGTETTSPLYQDTTFVIECGGQLYDSVTIEVDTTPTLISNRTIYQTHDIATLSWDTHNGDESLCTLSDGTFPPTQLPTDTGGPATGTLDIEVLAFTTYTIACPEGSVSLDIEIIPSFYES